MSLTIAVLRESDGTFSGAEIIGSSEELEGLRETIEMAIEDAGQDVVGSLLTDVGVAPLTIRAEES